MLKDSNPLIVAAGQVPEYYFQEDCYIAEILNQERHPDISIARARVAPGVTTVLHRLRDTQEKYFILSGEGDMEIEGAAAGRVRSGDLVIIPANARQRIHNCGAEDLVFLSICTPRFETACYEEV